MSLNVFGTLLSYMRVGGGWGGWRGLRRTLRAYVSENILRLIGGVPSKVTGRALEHDARQKFDPRRFEQLLIELVLVVLGPFHVVGGGRRARSAVRLRLVCRVHPDLGLVCRVRPVRRFNVTAAAAAATVRVLLSRSVPTVQ